jgi:hypothetical protein
MPLINFCALAFVFSCSLLTLELEAPPSSALFFLLKTLIGDFATTFFLFSSVVYISSLVFFTLVVLMHSPFGGQINTKRFLPISKQTTRCPSYPPYSR